MKKNLTSQDLQTITSVTLHHYETRASDFWESTKDHDVSQNYQALLGALPTRPGLRILDFGCGPGRDLLAFRDLGHSPVGLDGCTAFCAMAKKNSGCEVLHQNFLRLHLSPQSFDGIFANASLFHIPRQELPRILNELKAALLPGGILFSSNPRGSEEGWSEDRYGNYMELSVYQDLLQTAGFEILQHYYRPAGLPCGEQPWLTVVSRVAPSLAAVPT